MANVRFEVRYQFEADSRAVWDELVDWRGHGDWVPATRVEVGEGDPTEVGATFTAFTGYGPLTLEDRMRVTRCDWDDQAAQGTCDVDKLGPVLTGRAGFTVEPHGERTRVVWVEEVVVPYVPEFLSGIVGTAGAAGFRAAMRRLAALLARDRRRAAADE